MNHKSFPEAVYIMETDRLTAALSLLKKRKDIISWARFAVVILLMATLYYLYPVSALYTGIAALLLLAVFIRLVIMAVNNSHAAENYKRLRSVNRQEIQIASGDYTAFPDGSSFLSATHPYANDLDIFGKASLYQYTNRTQAEQAGACYADWLQHPATAAAILQRQEAVKELAPGFNGGSNYRHMVLSSL